MTMQLDTMTKTNEEGHAILSDRQFASPSESYSPSAIRYDRLLKRSFDILFALAGLICSSPVLLLALLLIPLQSKGSPIFVQQRVGKNGKAFKIIKLRTMYADSARYAFKTAKDDSRLTPLGKFLRDTNIDELPQLMNILLGDMSLIGPRPLSVDETNYISKHLNLGIAYPGFLPGTQPGLVGLEQINRHQELTYLNRFEYNYLYETGWSLAMDLEIFLKALTVCKQVCFSAIAGALLIAIVTLNLLIK